MITDVNNVQIVRKMTDASVASQACPDVSPATGSMDVDMGGTGDGALRSPPVPIVPTVMPVPGIVPAQALLIYGVDCYSGMGALLTAAHRL